MIPNRDEIMPVVLHYLADERERSADEIRRFVARHFALTSEEREEKRGRGPHSQFSNENAWALVTLQKQGRIVKVDASRKAYRITDESAAGVRLGPRESDQSCLNSGAEHEADTFDSDSTAVGIGGDSSLEDDRLGPSLRGLMEARGLTFRALGDVTGLSAGYLNHLVRGRRDTPPLETMERLAAAVGVQPEVFYEYRLEYVRESLQQGTRLVDDLFSEIADPTAVEPPANGGAAFGAAVARLMDKRGLSYREVAGEVGLSAGYLNHVVNGKRPVPSPTVFARIAERLGLNPADFSEYRLMRVREALAERPDVVDDLYAHFPSSARATVPEPPDDLDESSFDADVEAFIDVVALAGSSSPEQRGLRGAPDEISELRANLVQVQAELNRLQERLADCMSLLESIERSRS